MKTPSLFIFVCLIYFNGAAQPNDFSSIVRIVALNEFGENDIGTGILVGNDNSHLYIATANHVVKTANEAEVFFYNQTTAQTATVLQKDEKMDVAVLKMKKPNRQSLPHLLAADPKILEVQKKVLSIGHPGGSFWKSNYQNIIQEVSIYNQPEAMSITPQGIIPGCSGSIVLTYEGIWLGMITETTSVEAKCVKSDAIIKKLKGWNIPINLTIPKEPITVKIKGGNYDEKKITDFSIGKFEVSYEEFRLFVAATGYITDAEKEGFSWTFFAYKEISSLKDIIYQISAEVSEASFENFIKSIKINLARNNGWSSTEGVPDFSAITSAYIHSSKLDLSEVNELKYIERINWRQDVIGRSRNVSTFDQPIIHISYDDAMAYCEWLSKLHQTTYRLPTTSEWEYAATSRGSLTEATIDEVYLKANLRDVSFCNWTGWENCNKNDDGYETLAPVQAMQADGLGIFQMHGNVAEWCIDEKGYATQAGSHYQSFTRKVSRLYKKREANFRSAMVGFRVVKGR